MSIFETLRKHIDLTELTERFTKVEKNRGRCPFPDHRDDTPSFYLYDDQFHCYGCRRHGDVTDLWAGLNGIESGIRAACDLAREYSLELPKQGPEESRKAQERRTKEDRWLQQARTFYEALPRHPRVTEWWEKRGFDQTLRERFLLGSDEDGMAAVIPFWNRGRVQGLIWRKLNGKPKYIYPRAEDFAGGYRPLFIPGKTGRGIFLVEGIVDALAVVALGESAAAVGGTGVSQEQLLELRKIPTPVYILPDADEEGKAAAHSWARQLYPNALLCPAAYGQETEDA